MCFKVFILKKAAYKNGKQNEKLMIVIFFLLF